MTWADGDDLTPDTMNNQSINTLAIGTDDPLKSLHVQVNDLSLTTEMLGGDEEAIGYVFVGESDDAMVALSSSSEGGHGSGIDMLEIQSTGLKDKWTNVRLTTGDGAQGGSLAWYQGTDGYYPNNHRAIEWQPTGNFFFRASQVSKMAKFNDGFRSLRLMATDPRIRAVGSDAGEWSGAFVLDQLDLSEDTQFENCWGIIRQTNGNGTGDGSLHFTYGTDVDPAVNASLLQIESDGSVLIGSSTVTGEGKLRIEGTTPLSIQTAADANDMTENDFRLVFTSSGASLVWSSGASLYDIGSATSAAQPTS